jgi:hypothetical protein
MRSFFLFICALAIQELTLGQVLSEEGYLPNNSTWKVVQFRGDKKVKNIFLRSGWQKLSSHDKKMISFCCDSLVILKFISKKDTVPMDFWVRQIAPDSMEFFGIDRYRVNERKLTYNYPALRRYQIYTFSLVMKLNQVNEKELIFYSDKPRLKIKLRRLKDDQQ